MVEHLLSPAVLARASLRGNEYAWPPASVEMAINDAREHGFATLGGQAQFRLPDGTCELYWIDVDPSEQRPSESRHDWVQRSADEAIAKFRQRMASTNWDAEVQKHPFLRERAAAGIDLLPHLRFVLYFS